VRAALTMGAVDGSELVAPRNFTCQPHRCARSLPPCTCLRVPAACLCVMSAWRAMEQVLTAPHDEAVRDLQLNAALTLLCEANPQGSFVDEAHLGSALLPPLATETTGSGFPEIETSQASTAASVGEAAREHVARTCRRRLRGFAALGRAGLAVKCVGTDCEDENSVAGHAAPGQRGGATETL
jgi:hypothetical protein